APPPPRTSTPGYVGRLRKTSANRPAPWNCSRPRVSARGVTSANRRRTDMNTNAPRMPRVPDDLRPDPEIWEQHRALLATVQALQEQVRRLEERLAEVDSRVDDLECPV